MTLDCGCRPTCRFNMTDARRKAVAESRALRAEAARKAT